LSSATAAARLDKATKASLPEGIAAGQSPSSSCAKERRTRRPRPTGGRRMVDSRHGARGGGGGSFYRRRPRRARTAPRRAMTRRRRRCRHSIADGRCNAPSRIPRTHGGASCVLPVPDRRASPLARLLSGTRKNNAAFGWLWACGAPE